MATKSPGIYFTETDNTQYENPKAISGTTLAVVGYAAKGPIGIPTEINSWREFITVFGKPINGYYSGLAVKNFLTAGGTVLFLRVADGTASPSNYVVKNPVPERKGYITFSRITDILPKEINNDYIYAFKLASSSASEDWKFFFVRPPKAGKRLTQASVINQISNQLGATPATFEGSIASQNAMKNGIYGFNIELNGVKINKESDFFIETFENETKESFYNSLKNIIETGTNAFAEINLDTAKEDDSHIHVNLADADYSKIIGGRRIFKIARNGKQPENVEVEFTGENLTLRKVAETLDKKMNDTYGIRVILVQGNEGKNQRTKLVFFSNKKEPKESFDIQGLNPDVDADNFKYSLFVAQKAQSSQEAVSTGGSFYLNTDPLNDNKFLYVAGKGYTKQIAKKVENLNDFSIKYDEVKGNFVLTTAATGKTQSIKVVDCKYNELEPKLSFTTETGTKVFLKTFSLKGQDATNITVRKDENGKVRFEGISTTAPALAKVGNDEFIGGEGQENFKELLDLEKDPENPSGEGYDEPVEGNTSISASARDKVVFTSRELGSGTNNIAVEVYTTTSPIAKEGQKPEVKHNIVIYVDGNRKEAYEDISFNPDDGEDYFVKVLNKPVENGGSAYITAADFKKVYGEGHEEIELHDGIYKLGVANKSSDRAKSNDSLIIDYDSYEYSIGTDGIPLDEGNLLFEEAMRPGTSFLANKDLYDFHILIAPDDISESVQTACIKLCEDRGDAITIVDPPQGLDKKAVIDWHNGRSSERTVPLDSNYVATYWPWCKIYDNSTGSGKFAWVMPSVIMASQYVRIDRTVGCHMAPAGEVNGVLPVIDIEQYPNKLDRDELYTDYNRINPLTKFKDGTVVAYGEKTTQRANSVLTKIHTRRMLIQIKKQCREALRGYIFMPNTVDYLGKISNNITSVLEGYKSKGGLSFYKVICDETNNPTEVRQQDIINVDVALVPEGTIEQININLTLNKTAETITD